jgi:hypothetical protein
LAAALAESALAGSESKDKAGPWGQFTPSHLYDDGLYDPDCGSDDDFDIPARRLLLTHRRLLYFFLTKISEIYKGSPYTGGACPPKQGHEPVPIN